MTRKHFEVIARVLKAWRGAIDEAAHRELCEEFALELKTENERFDHDRFIKACGYN